MNNNEKPAFTEQEIEEMDDLYHNFGYRCAISEVTQFLKTVGYSEVNAVIIEIRKEFNRRISEMQDKFQEKYKDSTLWQTLSNRLDWTAKQKLNQDEQAKNI